MGKDDIDNKELLSEIENLEDDPKSGSAIKNKKGANIWVIIAILIVVIGLTSLYFGYNDYEYDFWENYEYFDEYTNDEIDSFEANVEINRKNFEEKKENIVVEEVCYSTNKELIAVISNNTGEAISDLKIEIIFYDGENKPIEIDSNEIGIIEENSKFYARFLDTPKNFERYDFLISKDYYWYEDVEYVTDKISYDVTEKDGFARVKIKNNYSEEISEADFQIVYYKNDKAIDISNFYIIDLEKGKSQTEELNLTIYNNETYEPIEYDRYEINLVGAYIYY